MVLCSDYRYREGYLPSTGSVDETVEVACLDKCGLTVVPGRHLRRTLVSLSDTEAVGACADTVVYVHVMFRRCYVLLPGAWARGQGMTPAKFDSGSRACLSPGASGFLVITRKSP